MWNFINSFFASSQYIPHGHCYLWQTPLVTLHILSDALIAIAYFSIPALLIYFVQKRQDVPFLGVFNLFGAFIVLCGAGHLLDIWTLWHPDYWVSGIERAITAFISCLTALQLVTLLPQFLALKTPAQLETINRELQQEIIERQQIEAERNLAYEELEFRVQERTVALEQSQQRLSRLIEQLPIGIVEWDLTGKITKWNPASERIFGYRQAEVLGQHFKLIVLEDHYQHADQTTVTIMHQRGESVSTNVNKTKTGEIITCEWHNNPLVAVDGTVLGAVSIVMDITDRKRIETERQQAEAVLQEREQFLSNIYEGVGCLVFVTDAIANDDVQWTGWSRSAEQATGLLASTMIGKTPIEIFGTAEGEIIRQNHLHCLRTGLAMSYEECLTFQGQETWWLTTLNPLKEAMGRAYRVVGTTINITDRKQAEVALQKALQETEYQSRLLRTVLDSTQDWIFAKDQNFRYILVNHSFADALKQPVEAMLGKDDLELGFPKELIFGAPEQNIRGFRHDDQVALAGERIHNSYDPVTTIDGSFRILDTSKAPLYDSDGNIFAMLGFSRDVTERHYAEEALRCSEAQLKKNAEELEQTLRELQRTQTQMIQTEKMSGLGQLVAGIAHEINNPVNFIHGNIMPAWQYAQDLLNLLNLYQTQVPSPDLEIQAAIKEIDLEFIREDLPKLLTSMQMGTERIREIVLSLRNFSRLDESEMKEIDLHQGIDNTLVILGHRLKAKSEQPGITIIRQYGDLPLVECYAGQLNQVFMNILSNAIDALEELNANRTRQQLKDQPGCITIRTTVVNSNWVTIAIADNGQGMSEAIQKQIFNPFFTTKSVGKGTGMGMAISYQIVSEKHGGKLECFSTPGVGAEFVIQIPVRQQFCEVS